MPGSNWRGNQTGFKHFPMARPWAGRTSVCRRRQIIERSKSKLKEFITQIWYDGILFNRRWNVILKEKYNGTEVSHCVSLNCSRCERGWDKWVFFLRGVGGVPASAVSSSVKRRRTKPFGVFFLRDAGRFSVWIIRVDEQVWHSEDNTPPNPRDIIHVEHKKRNPALLPFKISSLGVRGGGGGGLRSQGFITHGVSGIKDRRLHEVWALTASVHKSLADKNCLLDKFHRRKPSEAQQSQSATSSNPPAPHNLMSWHIWLKKLITRWIFDFFFFFFLNDVIKKKRKAKPGFQDAKTVHTCWIAVCVRSTLAHWQCGLE